MRACRPTLSAVRAGFVSPNSTRYRLTLLSPWWATSSPSCRGGFVSPNCTRQPLTSAAVSRPTPSTPHMVASFHRIACVSVHLCPAACPPTLRALPRWLRFAQLHAISVDACCMRAGRHRPPSAVASFRRIARNPVTPAGCVPTYTINHPSHGGFVSPNCTRHRLTPAGCAPAHARPAGRGGVVSANCTRHLPFHRIAARPGGDPSEPSLLIFTLCSICFPSPRQSEETLRGAPKRSTRCGLAEPFMVRLMSRSPNNAGGRRELA
jgi:hypothetical protein